jgi:hypothetical protein
MVIVRLNGGLGNQMFQYGYARQVAQLRGEEVLLDLSEYDDYLLREYELGKYNISAKIASRKELKTILGYDRDGFWFRALKKYGWHGFYNSFYDEAENHVPVLNDAYRVVQTFHVYLEGYFQDYRHVLPIRELLLKEFTLRSQVTEYGSRLQSEIAGDQCPVSIHIRRGDYATNQQTNMAHGVCSRDYYKIALKVFDESFPNARYYVFSDDIKSAEKLLSFMETPPVLIDNDSLTSPHENLAIMSACSHHIIANSSFSWWGAWLNPNPKKKVIFPTPWFNDEVQNQKYPNICPSTWIGMKK